MLRWISAATSSDFYFNGQALTLNDIKKLKMLVCLRTNVYCGSLLLIYSLSLSFFPTFTPII
jgi:hypothetical protein